jgi:tRNA-modifying protein YgfZ
MSTVASSWQELAAGESSVPIGVDRLDAVGPDTVKFLHSLVSQNITDLAVGSGAWTFLLQPQGKVTSFAYVRRLAEEHVALLTEVGFGEILHTALSRYRIRTKCELTLSLNSLAVVSFADGVPTFAVSETPEPFVGGEGPDAYNTARIVSGWPTQPNEITEATIPNETGVLRQSVNFTKGCYVGQELVERIDSRAATTPRRLVRLVDFFVIDAGVGGNDVDGFSDLDLAALQGLELFAALEADSAGIAVDVGGAGVVGDAGGVDGDQGVSADVAVVSPSQPKAVGTLTSIVRTSTGVAGFSALGYVTRSVSDGSQVTIVGSLLVATVAVLRNDMPAVNIAPVGVRSSATMGKKA